MTKRVIVMLLATVMVFALTACGNKTEQTPPATQPTTPSAAPTTPTVFTEPTEPAEERKQLQPLLEYRGELPALKSREEMLDIMQREVYGYLPPAPTSITFTTNKITPEDYCNGKAELYEVIAQCVVSGKDFTFPFRMAVPKNATEKLPFFMFIGFTKGTTSKYQSTEAVIDKGYAILYYDYRDIASDDSKFDNGLSTILYPNGTRGDTDPGKIAMWAWGAHRMMDYAETVSDKLDASRSVVCGHSRTGKAALLAGATDTRIQFTYSNNSGSTGAALSRKKAGENISRITDLFPYWFCKNYKKYVGLDFVGDMESLPFDQHYLIASIAPRKVLVGSATKDANADPLSEQLGCYAAGPAFPNGFVCDVMAVSGDKFFAGDVGYHLREGEHAFTETDWLRAVEFVDYHTKKAQ